MDLGQSNDYFAINKLPADMYWIEVFGGNGNDRIDAKFGAGYVTDLTTVFVGGLDYYDTTIFNSGNGNDIFNVWAMDETASPNMVLTRLVCRHISHMWRAPPFCRWS